MGTAGRKHGCDLAAPVCIQLCCAWAALPETGTWEHAGGLPERMQAHVGHGHKRVDLCRQTAVACRRDGGPGPRGTNRRASEDGLSPAGSSVTCSLTPVAKGILHCGAAQGLCLLACTWCVPSPVTHSRHSEPGEGAGPWASDAESAARLWPWVSHFSGLSGGAFLPLVEALGLESPGETQGPVQVPALSPSPGNTCRAPPLGWEGASPQTGQHGACWRGHAQLSLPIGRVPRTSFHETMQVRFPSAGIQIPSEGRWGVSTDF